MWLARGLEFWSRICHAHCKSGTRGIASQRRRSSASRSSMWCVTKTGLPNGVPKTLIPSNRHTSSPNVLTSTGRVPLLFQTCVLPWCSWMPAWRIKASARRSNKTLTLSGSHKKKISSKNAHNNSPTSKDPDTSSSAPWIPVENNRGINVSPCSPPSACDTVLRFPLSSTQSYVEGSE